MYRCILSDLMAELPKNPELYLSEYPPERIIGSECEYTIQNCYRDDNNELAETSLGSYVNTAAIESIGLIECGDYISNGSRIYLDVGHLEYATPECLGPRQAAIADLAGIEVMKRIVQTSQAQHSGLYRIAGTNIKPDEKARTKGYHENYMLPRAITEREEIDKLLPAFLASRIWAMSGGVSIEGFELSQKVADIGGKPITRNVERRTELGNKPMAIIPSEFWDQDVFSDPQWARIEVRYADPTQSRKMRYLGFAATSLVIRIFEHPKMFRWKDHDRFALQDPVAAAKQFSKDLSLSSTVDSVQGDRLSVININEGILSMVRKVADRIELPESEQSAIEMWQDTIDTLRTLQLPLGEYGDGHTLFDFAGRHAHLLRTYNASELSAQTAKIAQSSLTWDRIDPTGYATVWWQHHHNEFITDEEIESMVLTPPQETRAKLRGDTIKMHAKDGSLYDIDWATVTTDNQTTYSIGDPYGE